MSVTGFALAAIFLPLATFLLIAVAGPLRRAGFVAGVLSSAVAVISFLCSLAVLRQAARLPEGGVTAKALWLPGGGLPVAEIGVHLDGVSATMLAVVTLVAACVQLYSLGYLHHEPAPSLGRYFAWHSLFIFAMGSLVVAPNLLQLFLGWELVGLCSYLLIGYWWAKPSAAKAAVKALWTTKFADMGFLLALMVLYAETGGFSWSEAPGGAAGVAVAALLFVGVMGKSAQVPLHVWLPDAMEGPTPVSALLHAATMVAAGVFLIVRAYPLFAAADPVLSVMCWVGAGTAFIAACLAAVQDDIKKVLAYSTCSQLGYMVAALGSGAFLGGYFHLTTHAFFKALLFLGAGAAIHAVETNSIHEMGGLARRMPRSAALFIAGALALAGIPVFAGFFSKDLVLEELAHAGRTGPLLLCLAAAALTAWYITRVVVIAFFGRPGARTASAHESPAIMLAPMAALGLLTVGGGWLGGWFGLLWGEEYHFRVSATGVAALLLAAGGATASALRYGAGRIAPLGFLDPVRRALLAGLADRFWDRAYRGGLLVVSRAAGWVDRYLVDGAINVAGWGTIEGSRRLRAVQTGRAQDYVFAVFLGVVALVAFGVWKG